MGMVTATGAALLYMGNKTRNSRIRQRMLELWKDRSKPPGPQWEKVKRTMADWDLSAAALNEANRIWALHQADLKKAGTTRNSGKTFFKGQDEIYISKNKEVKLSKTGEYKPQGRYVTLRRSAYSAIPGLTDGKGDYMTANEFKTIFPTNFADKPQPVVGKDGAITGIATDGSKVKIFPGNPYYNKVLKNQNFRLPVEETAAIKSSNLPTAKQQSENLPQTTNQYSSRHQRNQTKSLNIPVKNDNNVSVVEESGAVTRYAPKYKQVGGLMINPGGLVGRNADVRRSDGRSTSLSIAQRDWKGIKKGEMLGVMTSNQRDLYDRDVLGIG